MHLHFVANERTRAGRELVDHVHKRITELCGLPYEALADLEAGGKDVEIEGSRGFVWTYVERSDNSAVRVIVQGGFPHRWLSFVWRMWVEGIEKRKDGTTRDLREDEMYVYI